MVFTHPDHQKGLDRGQRRPDWEFVLTADEFGRYHGTAIAIVLHAGHCERTTDSPHRSHFFPNELRRPVASHHAHSLTHAAAAP